MFATCKAILEQIQNENESPAVQIVVNMITGFVWPSVLSIKSKLAVLNESACGKGKEFGNLSALNDCFYISTSQIKKSLLSMFQILKTEVQFGISMKETRDCIVDRLLWCFNRLDHIMTELSTNTSKILNEDNTEIMNKSAFVTPMYLINWVDHIFDLLSTLTNLTYTNNFGDFEVNIQNDNELIECLSSLHLSIDEMLMSAVTLANFCLEEDQRIVAARCQVVLRETKNLVNELLNCDLNEVHKATKNNIKHPIKPSNVNVSVGVLKESLYSLESSTNTALLSLLIKTFSTGTDTIDELVQHCLKLCDCEDCPFVRDFDYFNERLIQIAGFAISCTSDPKRMYCLRSCLASFEALDPHIVPSILVAPNSFHTKQLVHMWKNEYLEVKTNVLLTVDPSAFIERVRESVKELTLSIMESEEFDKTKVEQILGIAVVVLDFFNLYQEHDPEALVKSEHLELSTHNLRKAVKECRYVYEHLNLENSDCKNRCTYERLLKRLKLLYTMINRINTELCHNGDNFDNSFVKEMNSDTILKKRTNETRLVNKAPTTKTVNLTKTIFTKVNNTTSKSTAARLNERLKKKKLNSEINFSLKLDSDDVASVPIFMEKGFSPIHKSHNTFYRNAIGRDSLRKTVLKKFSKFTLQDISIGEALNNGCANETSQSKTMDTMFDLQITEILDQLSEISDVLTVTNKDEPRNKTFNSPSKSNILRLRVNESIELRDIWNITVNSSEKSDLSGSSSQRDISTHERLSDLVLVEEKLKKLKSTDIF